ncbi:uncharacterized protein PV09_00955 [Verruconis gallopava]|uniref:4a-hydroxytetrahydrobiopterin dehydratase n=1 Tax=Verruconis gallopava TaxID=253628 RepID=A0A0D2B9X1_9PEZI|nr:uncharacterized protein PV09_00955 [Verruconis gallopava]KIW08009.1 hypothetical protein PV09_00955 [Verruconis gallopava]
MARVLIKIPSLSLLTSLRRSSISSFPLSRILNYDTLRSTMASAPHPKFSAGSNEKMIADTLSLELLPPQSSWRLTPSGEGIQRTFKFKTFKAAWSFMDRVAAECKTARHHPEWANVYNTVFIRWTTHQPKGLSEKDVAMAMFCDEHAKELGVLDDGGDVCMIGEGPEGLADGLAKAAGDCCVPKHKNSM